jgi:hypothetical protein
MSTERRGIKRHANEAGRDIPGLSTSLIWPRTQIDPKVLKASLDRPPDESEVGVHESRGVFWISRGGAQLEPHLRLNAEGGSYDVHETYEEAGRRRNARLSPHTALRTAYGDRGILEFLAQFGPLLKSEPHVILENPSPEKAVDWHGSTLRISSAPSQFFINLYDFRRRQKCYSMALRLYDALHDEDRLRREWRDAAVGMQEIVRGGFPPILRNEHVKRWLVEPVNEAFDVSIWELEREFEPSQPTLTDWVAKAPVEELRTLARDAIVRAVDGNTGERVRWDVRTGEGGRPILRPVVETPSLWAAIWNFFAMDTDNGKLWRLCPHCNKIFSPPRKDRYYCTARLQQLSSKRKWARQHR